MSNLPVIIKMSENDNIVNRVKSLLKDEAGSFIASVINISRGSETLQLCDPVALWGAAIKSAAVKLPIEPALGYACIVPFKNSKTQKYEPSFIIQVKGLIQLALRTGQYKEIMTSAIYEDEIVSYDPIRDKVKLVDKMPENPKRYDGKSKPVGYYASFELLNGFSKESYWDLAKIMNHVSLYVPTWDKKKKEFYYGSFWTKNFDRMAEKTVLKYILSGWGLMSVEMVKAVQNDESESIDANVPPANDPNIPDAEDVNKKIRRGKANKEGVIDAEVTAPTDTQPEAPAPAEEKDPFDD
jgi:recombination protein RecT